LLNGLALSILFLRYRWACRWRWLWGLASSCPSPVFRWTGQWKPALF